MGRVEGASYLSSVLRDCSCLLPNRTLMFLSFLLFVGLVMASLTLSAKLSLRTGYFLWLEKFSLKVSSLVQIDVPL